MVAYRTSSDLIEIVDPGLKVNVAMIENDDKICQEFKCKHFLNQSPSFDRKLYYRHSDTKYNPIVQ